MTTKVGEFSFRFASSPDASFVSAHGLDTDQDEKLSLSEIRDYIQTLTPQQQAWQAGALAHLVGTYLHEIADAHVTIVAPGTKPAPLPQPKKQQWTKIQRSNLSDGFALVLELAATETKAAKRGKDGAIVQNEALMSLADTLRQASREVPLDAATASEMQLAEARARLGSQYFTADDAAYFNQLFTSPEDKAEWFKVETSPDRLVQESKKPCELGEPLEPKGKGEYTPLFDARDCALLELHDYLATLSPEEKQAIANQLNAKKNLMYITLNDSDGENDLYRMSYGHLAYHDNAEDKRFKPEPFPQLKGETLEAQLLAYVTANTENFKRWIEGTCDEGHIDIETINFRLRLPTFEPTIP